MAHKKELAAFSPIIVIDDDDFFRVAIEAVLRNRFEVETVVTCATATDAVARLSEEVEFGLGLVDLNMTGIDNRHLLNTLKAAQPAMCLVVMSGSRSRDDILMALSAGAQGFINKGLGIGETEVALRQIADGAVYVPPFTPQSADQGFARETQSAADAASLAVFTPRQREVLELLVEGQPNKGIARALDINHSTVKFHLSFIFRILGASNRVEAAIIGAKLLGKSS